MPGLCKAVCHVIISIIFAPPSKRERHTLFGHSFFFNTSHVSLLTIAMSYNNNNLIIIIIVVVVVVIIIIIIIIMQFRPSHLC